MTGLETLAARLALGATAGVAGVVISSLRAIHRPGEIRFRRIASLAFFLSRFGLFTTLFLVFRVAPRGDIPSFYWSEAESVLHGRLPYRDFASSYAPLHPYMDAAVLRAWHSPLGLILFAICAEFLLFWLWLRVGAKLFPERQLRIAAVLYLASAMSLQFVAIDGQDNVVVALLVLLALTLAIRSRAFLSGALTAAGVVAVKLIPIFYAPVFFAGLRKRWAWAIGFAVVIVAGYGGFAALHAPVLQPLAIEGPLKSSGTVPYLIETITGLNPPVQFWDALMLLALAGLYATVWRKSRGGASATAVISILWCVAAATMILVTFANKSWSPYLLLCLFPLCLAVAAEGPGSRAIFGAFGLVALAEKSYWATLLSQDGAPQLRSAVLHGNRTYIGFLPIEVLLLLGYGWLLALCLRRLRHSGEAPALAAGDSRSAGREQDPGALRATLRP